MRRLSRETRDVVEQVVRTGEPILVTIHGRPEIGIVPLYGRIGDWPDDYGPKGAPEHVLAALRESEADIVAGRLLTTSVQAEPSRGELVLEDKEVGFTPQPLPVPVYGLSPDGTYISVKLSLSGFSKDNVSVERKGNRLTISAEPDPHSGAAPVRGRLSLPPTVILDRVRAQMLHGELTLTLPLHRPPYVHGGGAYDLGAKGSLLRLRSALERAMGDRVSASPEITRPWPQWTSGGERLPEGLRPSPSWESPRSLPDMSTNFSKAGAEPSTMSFDQVKDVASEAQENNLELLGAW